MTISSREDLAGMCHVGQVVGLTIQEMKAAARPGMTTAELDRVGADFLRRHGARSAPREAYDFPGFTCLSLNEEVVHGIPGPRRIQPGDVLKIDVTAELGGYVADAAVTVTLPPVAPKARKLRRCAEAAFEKALGAARAGNRVSEIGRAVDTEVRRHGFRVLRDLAGHGVGRQIHEPPSVPNYFDWRNLDELEDGMVLAIEPMLSAEAARIVTEADGWTIRTHNRCLAAHYEHTVVVTKGKPRVLTAVA
ncbi:MAG TPA: type I methionyl aminopeptidase [Thermoanaerobaculia bacterium]|nr:type I methionyl aminopeptidase [Thermoanaerobaculia bacterium]